MKGTLRPGRKAGVLALAVLLLTCVLMAGAVSAATYYVSVNGNDVVNDGTSGSPFATIQKAVETAGTDDYIIVEAGTYDAFKIGTEKSGLTIEGTVDKDNSLKTIIRTLNESSSTWEDYGCGGIDISSPFITLKNLSIKSDGYTNGRWYASPVGHWNENTNAKNGLTIDGCEITNAADDGKGIAIFFVASDITISNTSISGFNDGWHMEGSAGMGKISITDSSFDVTRSAINYIPYVGPTSSDPTFIISETTFTSGNVILWDYANQKSIDTPSNSIQNVELSGNTYENSNIILINFEGGQEKEVTSPDKDPVMSYSELKYGVKLNPTASKLVINYGSSSEITYTKEDNFWKGDDGSVCDKDGNPYSAKIGDVYYPTLDAALDEAKNGDAVTLLQDVSLPNALTIDKEITLTATDSADKPTLTVPQVLIAVPNVTLDNLKIQQTAGTDPLDYTIQVTADGTGGQITVTDSEIIPVKDGRGFTSDTGAAFDITFTGNIVKAANEEDKLAYAIYINGYDNKYVFQENIIGSCFPYQFGFDQYVDALNTPVDISKNYWGGSKPSIELFVGSDPGEPDLTGQNVYYTQLNDDGTIDEGSLVYGEGALQDLIDNAENGAVLELAGGEYSCPTGLVIDKDITITAADPSNMPKIVISGSPNNGHVGSVQIGVKNVTLSYLSFTTTQDQLFYVQDGSDPTKTVTIDHCYAEIPEGTGHFYGDYAGTECNIVLINNKVESEGTPNLAIYFNVNEKSTYKIEKNIFPECNHKQVGITVYSDDHAPVDISENYWGGSEPTFECFVMEGNQAMPAEADDAGLSGQGTYYTKLNSDGTIDENSIYPPVEPTPQPPSSSSSGNMNNAYRVLFNDGATTLSVQTDLSSGDKLTKPETPVKDGYTFAGWYKDSACTQGWDFETGISGDMTLYAKWTAAGSSGETEATTAPTATSTAVTTPQPTKTQTAAATTSAPEATTAAGVSPTLTQAPAPVAGALFGLLAAGVLLRRRFQ